MVSHIGNPTFTRELAYLNLQLPDPGFQILALFRYWNMIEYWYPNRDLIGSGWDRVLAEFVPKLALAKNRDAYQLQMLGLIARVQDTHANLWSSLSIRPPAGNCAVPVRIRFVENQAVVSALTRGDAGKDTPLQVGDVIRQVDGVDLPKLIADWTPYYADSNEAARLRDIGRGKTHGDCAQPAELGISRGDQMLDLNVARLPVTIDVPQWHDRAGAACQKLSTDVAYLKLSTAKIADAAHYIEMAAGTKGLIVDIRNYPDEFMVFALGQHFVHSPTPFASFTAADVRNPGAFYWSAPVSIAPAGPEYKGKVVILVDEVSQSQAEYTAMAFRAAPNAV